MFDPAAQRVELIGLPFTPAASTEAINELLNQKDVLRLVTFVAPNSWALAKRHPEYMEALQKMTLNMASSAEVAWACRLITKNPCVGFNLSSKTISRSFFQAIIAKGASVMLAGGRPGVDEAMHEKILDQYPALNIIGTVHGFGEFEPKIAEIVGKSPDVLLVDMPTPRQEAFLLMLMQTGYRGMAITCQGFFEERISESPFYPPWIERWNLDFIWRFYREPPNLWARYVSDYSFFVLQTAKAFVMRLGSRSSRPS